MGARPRDRKETIRATAAALFAERGFGAVGVDDIGAAVGITGPAIYRHYRGKDALLSAVCLDTVQRLHDAVRAEPTTPVAALTRAALDDADGLRTYLRERERLAPEAVAAIAPLEAAIRRVVGRFGLAAKPSKAQLALRLRAVNGLLADAAVATAPSRPQRDRLVTAMATAVLGASAPPTAVVTTTGRTWQPEPTRRDRLVDVALPLFRARGFHGVGMDELGAAAGSSGPALYRLVASKADLLVDAYDRTGQRVAVGVSDALSEATSSRDALRRLAASYVAVAADSVDLIVVTSREGSALPASERPRLARRRSVVRSAWLSVVRELRPDLDEASARLVVGAAFAVVNEAVQALPSRGPDLRPELVAITESLIVPGEVNER